MLLKQIEIDKKKSCHEKSINLICLVHKNLIDSYASHNHPKLETKFLMWLFVRLMCPLINFIDKFIQEGVIFDIKSELGFQRNLNITIENPDYWKQGHALIFKNNTENYNKLPVFMQSFLNNSFNICKYMEVVKLISNFSENSDIYARFLSLLFIDCPYLKNHFIQEDLTQSKEKASPSKINLVEINFKNLEHHSSGNNLKPKRSMINSIENIFNNHLNFQASMILSQKCNADKKHTNQPPPPLFCWC